MFSLTIYHHDVQARSHIIQQMTHDASRTTKTNEISLNSSTPSTEDSSFLFLCGQWQKLNHYTFKYFQIHLNLYFYTNTRFVYIYILLLVCLCPSSSLYFHFSPSGTLTSDSPPGLRLNSGSAPFKVHIGRVVTSYRCAKDCPNSGQVGGHSKCALEMRTTFG